MTKTALRRTLEHLPELACNGIDLMMLGDVGGSARSDLPRVSGISVEPPHVLGQHRLLAHARLHPQARGRRNLCRFRPFADHHGLADTHESYGDTGRLARTRITEIDANVRGA